MPDAPMIPPQMTGNARRSGCAVRAPAVPRAKLTIRSEKPVPTGLVDQVVEDIYNALMTLDWAAEKGPGAQAKIWSTGPYNEASASLAAFFGPYSERLFKQIHAQMRGLFALFQARQPLTITVGNETQFDSQKRHVTLHPNTDTEVLIGMLAAALNIPNPADFAAYIDKRGIAAANCIVSDAQM